MTSEQEGGEGSVRRVHATTAVVEATNIDLAGDADDSETVICAYVDGESIYNRPLFEYVPTKKGKQTASPSLIRAAQHGSFPFCSDSLSYRRRWAYDVDLFRDLDENVNTGQTQIFLGCSNFVEQEAFIYFCERGIYFKLEIKTTYT